MPLAYLITWRTYGTFLHGDTHAVDPRNNSYGQPRLPHSNALNQWERNRMSHPPLLLDQPMRETVADSIAATSTSKSWNLLALNVRTNHVHLVIATDGRPEPALRTLKAWATRDLRRANLLAPDQPAWSRGGSTRYLLDDDDVERAIHYTNEMQDLPRNPH